MYAGKHAPDKCEGDRKAVNDAQKESGCIAILMCPDSDQHAQYSLYRAEQHGKYA